MRWSSRTAQAAVSRSRTAPAAKPCTWRAFWMPLSAGLAPAPDHEADAADEHRQAQPLPHRHAEGEGAEERVGLARELGEEAEHRVADQEQGGNLAARPRLAGEPPEQAEERDALAGELIQLRRMPRRVARAAKHHRPGHVADAAPELAVDEIAQASRGDAGRHERRGEIHHLQIRHAVLPGGEG